MALKRRRIPTYSATYSPASFIQLGVIATVDYARRQQGQTLSQAPVVQSPSRDPFDDIFGIFRDDPSWRDFPQWRKAQRPVTEQS